MTTYLIDQDGTSRPLPGDRLEAEGFLVSVRRALGLIRVIDLREEDVVVALHAEPKVWTMPFSGTWLSKGALRLAFEPSCYIVDTVDGVRRLLLYDLGSRTPNEGGPRMGAPCGPVPEGAHLIAVARLAEPGDNVGNGLELPDDIRPPQ